MLKLTKEALKDNPEALAEVTAYMSTNATLQESLTATTGKLTDTIKGRDKAKNENLLVRKKFNLEDTKEINDEWLETIGARKTEDIKKLEEKWSTENKKLNDQLSENQTLYDAKIKTLTIDSALAKISATAGLSKNPILIKSFQEAIRQGAIIGDDGNITYQDENNVPQFHDGKPMTVEGKIAQMKSNEANDVYFDSSTKGGTGGSGGAGGKGGVTKAQLADDNAERGAYIAKHGADAFHALPDE